MEIAYIKLILIYAKGLNATLNETEGLTRRERGEGREKEDGRSKWGWFGLDFDVTSWWIY